MESYACLSFMADDTFMRWHNSENTKQHREAAGDAGFKAWSFDVDSIDKELMLTAFSA